MRRERLNALVKRNLTTILLDVTDAMFGARLALTLSPWEEKIQAENEVLGPKSVWLRESG